MIEEENKPDNTIQIKSNFNLLDLGKNLVRTSNKRIEEKNLIIIGNKASGKSSVFNVFMQSSAQKESYTPSCGINYGFIRYQPSSSKKIILNVYEIGGDIKIST